MSRRFLLATALIAGICMIAGLLVLDIPIVRLIQASSIGNAPLFEHGLDALDALFGIHVSFWLTASVMILGGAILLALARNRIRLRKLALALLGAGLVQAASIGLMMLGKTAFGRVRPMAWLESGEMFPLWFVGGGSFPSGHGAFYFGLFLPLAAAAPRAWQRTVLLAPPLFVIAARIDMGKHFLSDVAASALIAACMALLVSAALRHWQANEHDSEAIRASRY